MGRIHFDVRIKLGAALWGFAEATLFFIVPDVYLTGVGLYDVRKSLFACLYALLGAMVGGTIMYYWGMRDAAGALGALDAIPSISTDMLARARADVVDMGTRAVPRGLLFGVPYKIFAVQAGSVGVGLISFLLISIPARLIRFLVTTTVIPFLVKRMAGRRPIKLKLIILVTGWAIFYLFYFLKMPN
jgi:membrane protein YqaA with SNARE-associated domain